MIANKEWKSHSTKNQKVVNLTTEVSNLREHLSSAKSNFKKKESNRPPHFQSGNNILSKISSADLWRVTDKGATMWHDGVKYEWCPMHKSNDESVLGNYTKHPHDHDAWFANRQAMRSKFDRNARTTAKPDQVSSDPTAKRAYSLKLALNQKIATAMVTQHNVTPADADAKFNETHADAYASLN